MGLRFGTSPSGVVQWAALACLAGAAPAMAHHSASMFDTQHERTLQGSVREFQFNNPHCFIQLLVSTADGMAEWSIEMGAPAQLLRAGWKPDTLKPGQQLSVLIDPLKSGEKGGNFVSALSADGRPIGGT